MGPLRDYASERFVRTRMWLSKRQERKVFVINLVVFSITTFIYYLCFAQLSPSPLVMASVTTVYAVVAIMRFLFFRLFFTDFVEWSNEGQNYNLDIKRIFIRPTGPTASFILCWLLSPIGLGLPTTAILGIPFAYMGIKLRWERKMRNRRSDEASTS